VVDSPRSNRDADWAGVRLHIVTGKGGTGKTTVAAALALALAADGGRVLLTEVEGRQGIAQLFDTAPLPYEERRIAVAPDGGEVYGLAIDPEAALLDYLEMFYRLGRAGKMLKRFGFVDFATTVAPGLRDVLLTGKACEAVRRKAVDRPGKRFRYDAVVMDGPPTGRVGRFLNVNAEVAGLAKVGPVRTQAEAVIRVLTSVETAVHVVTLLEEMPIQETIDSVDELRQIGMPVGGVLINQVREPILSPDELTAAARNGLGRTLVAQGVKQAGLATTTQQRDRLVTALLDEAREHAERIGIEDGERKRLAGLDLPSYDLPFIADGMDLAGLYRLAGVLRDQGAA
jgi:anion-transporting  ArsA/GET3 family ATPase